MEKIHNELLSLMRCALGGLRNYMKPVEKTIADYSVEILDRHQIRKILLSSNIEQIRGADILLPPARDALSDYFSARHSGGLNAEIEGLELLVNRLSEISLAERAEVKKRRRLFTTLGASASMAIIILVI